MTERKRRRPEYFLLGAPKCGTTALASYLAMHPALQVSEPKEPHYFCKDLRVGGLPVASDDEYLARFFPGLDESRASAALDASVWYLYSQVAVDEILQFQPNARFLVMLRNPVDMAYSLHSMLHFMRQEDVFDFGRAWSLQEERRHGRSLPKDHWIDARCFDYKAACSLGTQLQRLLERVARDRVHIELQDDLFSNPKDVYTRVLAFMGIPDDGRTRFPKINAGRKVNNRLLVAALRSSPSVFAARAVKRLFGLKSLHVGRVDAPLRADERRLLERAFFEEIKLMENILDRDLQKWLKLTSTQTA